MLAVVAIAAATFALHMVFNGRYGYFRDEFDYIICGNHPAWGYVDQPPLVPILSRIFRALFGDSLRSIRLMPALSASTLILLTGIITRELGGKRFAVALSALTILIAPIYLSGGSLLTSNCCLEVLLWMGCVYFAFLAAKHDQPRYWLCFGVVAGIGLQEKYSITVLGFAIVVGLLLTRQRRFLWSKWMWMGGAAAFFIFLPNLLWNVFYHWPFVQLMRNIKAEGRDVVLSPWQFFSQQILLLHHLSAVIWITGVMSGSTTTTVKATVSGCTVKGTSTDKVASGTVEGTIKGSAGTAKSPSGTCGGLTRSNAVTGTLSTKWKATPGVPNSVLTLKSISGAIKSNHGTFIIPGSIKGSAAGPFEGTNAGASDKIVAQTTETATRLATACATGISSLAIEAEPGVTPVSLG